MSLDRLPRLLVEGTSDEYAITQLLMQHGINAHAKHGKRLKAAVESRIQIVVEYPSDEISAEQSGGRDKLLQDWQVRIRNPHPAAIGLVLDADTQQLHGRGRDVTWIAVRDRLIQSPAGIANPMLGRDGFFGLHAETKTPLGVWVMPDNESEGSLEEFLRQLIAADDSLIAFADGSARCAKLEPYFAPFDEKDLQQAIIATWLAWQNDPPMTYGTAFKCQRFEHDAPLAARFVAWVRRLLDHQKPSG
jgi:hypothetical protein